MKNYSVILIMLILACLIITAMMMEPWGGGLPLTPTSPPEILPTITRTQKNYPTWSPTETPDPYPDPNIPVSSYGDIVRNPGTPWPYTAVALP